MRLRSLELENFRKFTQPVRLSGLGDRVNVLSGPNEFGKSTLLAAIRGVMFERYKSSAEPVRRMQSWRGNAAPRVAMEFELDGQSWRIEKRFLQQPSARLISPDGGVFENDAAEDELQRLLGFGASGNRGATPDQMGVWGALWVAQTQSVHQPDLNSDLARSTITGCLDAEVGVLTGTEKGQALIRAVQADLGKLLDGKGKPRGRLKEVKTELAALQQELAGLRSRSARLAEDADALRIKEAERLHIDDPQAEARDRADLQAARQRREAAISHAQRLENATAARRLAEGTRSRIDHDIEARQARSQAVIKAEAALSAAVQARLSADEDFRTAESAHAVLGSRLEEAEARARNSVAALHRARRIADLVRQSGALTMQRETLEKAEQAQHELLRLTGRMQANPVTRQALAGVQALARDCESARVALDAQATRLTFDLLDGAVNKIQVAGTNAPGNALRVTEATEIVIDGVGTILIEPGIANKPILTSKLASAEAALQRQLSALGCAAMDEAEHLSGERDGLERDASILRERLALLTPGDARSGLQPGIGALRDHLAVAVSALDEALRALNATELPDAAHAQSLLSAAECAEREADRRVQDTRAEAALSSERLAAARQTLALAQAAMDQRRSESERLIREATAAEMSLPFAELRAARETADSECARHAATIDTLAASAPADSVAAAEARIERLETALAHRQRARQTLAEAIAGLRARIAAEGGHGLDETIAITERRIGELQRESDSLERDVAVLTLLRDELLQAEREVKQLYLAPVVNRVRPYLRSLFPGADLSCDESLRITGLTRETLGTEAFELLSHGTQEQMAVLARLAFAEMLADQGKPAMVILDDALAYSDSERTERMFDVLTQAGRKIQILVLTCRQDMFARLGGEVLELRPHTRELRVHTDW